MRNFVIAAWIVFAVALALEGRVAWIGWRLVVAAAVLLIALSCGYVAQLVRGAR